MGRSIASYCDNSWLKQLGFSCKWLNDAVRHLLFEEIRLPLLTLFIDTDVYSLSDFACKAQVEQLTIDVSANIPKFNRGNPRSYLCLPRECELE